MLNESNNLLCLQKYIICSIVKFFSNVSEVVTSRYVLYFDSRENIIDFDRELKTYFDDNNSISLLKARLGNPNLEISTLDNYLFKNDEGSVEFEATQIRVANGNCERIIVFIPDYDKDGTTLGDAFKNNIRNKFVDEGEDKILFYLSMQNIASVSKTTENFQRQGMPLSVESVFQDLLSRIHIVQGVSQRTVIQTSLYKIKNNKPQNDNSLLEFAPIMRIIESQQLLLDDFHDLHLFPMALTDLGKKDCFLADNYKLFRRISLALNDRELETEMRDYDAKIISDIQKAFEKDEDNWDKGFTYETIVKHKKSNAKKFKLDQPIVLLDSNDNEVSKDYYIDFLKNNSTSFIIFTKDYQKEKVFKIQVRFTQKASVAGAPGFEVYPINARGTSYKIILNKDKNFYHGKVCFVGGKKSEFTIYFSVMNVPASFLSNSCVGMKEMKNNDFLYLLESCDYSLTFGEGGVYSDMIIEMDKSDIISWPFNTSNITRVKFKHSDDEAFKDYSFKADLDNQECQISMKVNFSEEKRKVLGLDELFNRCFVYHNIFSLEDNALYNVNKRSEKYDTGEFDVSGNKYKIVDLFVLEQELIKGKIFSCNTSGLKIYEKIDISIPDDIKSVLSNICNYYEKLNTIPSLCYINDVLYDLLDEYLNLVIKYVGEESAYYVDKKPISSEVLNIFKIGMIIDSDDLIWLSPLNPLSVAYQLQLFWGDSRLVELDTYLYSCLGYGNSLPFIENNDGTIYQAIKGEYPILWACYCDSTQSIKGEESTFANKIQDYCSKFGYLFNGCSNNRIIINIINIQHTSELIKALMKLYKGDVRISNMTIEINYYYSGTGKNDFDHMCDSLYVEKMASVYFGTKDLDKIEKFCDWYSDNIFYYAIPDQGIYKYSHICFCAIQGENNKNLHNTVSSADSGVMLNGLISDVPSYLDKESGIYKYGYGSKHSGDILSESRFFKVANALNELAMCKEGSTATRNLSIAQGVQNTKSEKLMQIYKSSNWVVFVEPKIDLDFFIKQSEEQEDELIIIHYPDKNVSSAGYTSITVTQKSEQYIEVIREILYKELPLYDGDMDVKRIICDFNSYSGEWLMHFINQKQLEEKVSLVSAINFSREYFNVVYPEYVWVPLALDEILRVTGSIGGPLVEVLFSKKALEKRKIIENQNATSDDLLMAGLKVENGELHVIYIPVEVKHGKCGQDIKAHAHKQVINTAELISKSFMDVCEDGKGNIDKKIYRNYMVQHIISNIEKMIAYKIADSDEYKPFIDSEYRICLMNDLYKLDLTNNTDRYAFYFVEGQIATNRQKNSQDKVIEISTSLKNMYEFLINPDLIKSEVDLLNGTDMSIDLTDYEINVLNEELDEEYSEFEELENEITDKIIESEDQLSIESESYDIKQETDANSNDNNHEEIEIIRKNEKGMSIILGTDDRNGEPVVWYPNYTKQLFHANTGIIGTMGTGKTQFTKSLITQLYREQENNVDGKELGILIFDYKGDYNESKKDFGEVTNATVYKPYHLPFNPLALTQTSAFKPLLPIHTANAFKDTLSRIYGLGPKQQDSLVKCINEAYSLRGIKPNDKDTWGNKAPTFEQVYQCYSNDEEIKKNDSLAAAMNKLHQFEVFEGNPDNTKSLYDLLNGVVVIDLHDYDEDIKHLIVAITLDLFYAQMQAAGFSKVKDGVRQLTKVILVDEADNFMSKGFPSLKKILKEGREFGVCTVLSTQFLEHFGNGDDDYSKYILTWIVHNVSDLKTSDVDYIFNTEPKSQDSIALFNQIKKLELHHSIIRIGTGRAIYLQDKPFWKLYEEIKE